MAKNSSSATAPTYDRVNDPHGNTDSLTYEQLVFQTVRDPNDPNTVTALRLWTGTVVVKTDYSENILFSDHFIDDYNSLEEFGGAQ